MKKLTAQYGADNLIVVYGLNQPFSLRVMAHTYKDGDPSFAGRLAGVALGLASYHILELKEQIPSEVWSEEMAMSELELEGEAVATIIATMREARV